jgi:hypothetical protein
MKHLSDRWIANECVTDFPAATAAPIHVDCVFRVSELRATGTQFRCLDHASAEIRSGL